MKPVKQALFALLVGFALISFWSGVSSLLKIYLFPKNPVLGAWFSVIIGLTILGLTHTWTKELA